MDQLRELQPLDRRQPAVLLVLSRIPGCGAAATPRVFVETFQKIVGGKLG